MHFHIHTHTTERGDRRKERGEWGVGRGERGVEFLNEFMKNLH
jgi:hypothetical protein